MYAHLVEPLVKTWLLSKQNAVFGETTLYDLNYIPLLITKVQHDQFER